MGTRDDAFARTFADSPIGMAMLDSTGRYLEINEAYATILGRELTYVPGRHFSEFTHADDLSRDFENLVRVAHGEIPSSRVDKRLLHSDGSIVWARVTVSSVADAEDPRGHRFVAQIVDVSEIRMARDLLERRAQYDPLTGLATKALLLEKLERALDAHETSVACLFVDLDHFSWVNDSLGQPAADSLLIEVARRIQAAVRPGDTVARLGGDEFVVVVEDVGGADSAVAVMHGVAAAVRQPCVIDGHELAPTVTAGLAMAEHGINAETLVRNAEMAMYTAKHSSRGGGAIYESSMREIALSRLSIEEELRAAIREGDLVVHYQPIVDLESRAVVAYEALVRWQHPHRGLLMPDDFIPVSEDANLVIPLGAAVIHEACAFLAARPGFAGKIFVNVSTRQIGTADLAMVVRRALEATGAPARQLCLEITETGMLLATATARADLKALTELGIELILDDFGTGYSALSSVLQNPVAGLKLAREFTLRLGDKGTGDRISTAMAALTRSLSMFGVIEGIETEAQFAMARRHGWQLGQGFLFGHPVPASAIPLDAEAPQPGS